MKAYPSRRLFDERLAAAKVALDVAGGDVELAADVLGVGRTTMFTYQRRLFPAGPRRPKRTNAELRASRDRDLDMRVHAVQSVTQDLLAREVAEGRRRMIVLIRHGDQ